MYKKTVQLLALVTCLGFMYAVRAADDAKPYDTFGKREAIRMVCLGDSITQAGAYVSALQTALGKQWVVTNLGNSGATLLKKGDKPYSRLPQFAQAIQLKPDVVTIMLGTNDSKPGNWTNKAEFEADYKSMIDDLKKANRKVVIYCCVPPPAGGNKWSINGTVIKDEVGPQGRQGHGVLCHRPTGAAHRQERNPRRRASQRRWPQAHGGLHLPGADRQTHPRGRRGTREIATGTGVLVNGVSTRAKQE